MQGRGLGDDRRLVLGGPVEDQDGGPDLGHQVLQRTGAGSHDLGGGWLEAGDDEGAGLGAAVQFRLELGPDAVAMLGDDDDPVPPLVERPAVEGQVDQSRYQGTSSRALPKTTKRGSRASPTSSWTTDMPKAPTRRRRRRR